MMISEIFFYLSAVRPSDHSHLCPLKCHLIFGRPYYRSCLWYNVSSVVCRRLSVTFCIVAKRYVLAKNCLKERIGNQGQKVDFLVAAIFLLPVSPLRPPRRPFLPYFCSYSPAIGTIWYKWTF